MSNTSAAAHIVKGAVKSHNFSSNLLRWNVHKYDNESPYLFYVKFNDDNILHRLAKGKVFVTHMLYIPMDDNPQIHQDYMASLMYDNSDDLKLLYSRKYNRKSNEETLKLYRDASYINFNQYKSFTAQWEYPRESKVGIVSRQDLNKMLRIIQNQVSRQMNYIPHLFYLAFVFKDNSYLGKVFKSYHRIYIPNYDNNYYHALPLMPYHM